MKWVAFILLVFILLASSVFAGDYPVDKGSTIISGGFSFANYSGDLYEDGEGNSAITIIWTPSVATFVVPNLALGGNMIFEYTSQGDCSATAIAVGPKMAYFIGGPNSKSYPFFGMGLNYLRQTIDYGELECTSYGTKFVFSAGVMVMVAPHWGFGFEGVYNSDNMKLKDSDVSASGNVFGVVVSIAGFEF